MVGKGKMREGGVGWGGKGYGFVCFFEHLAHVDLDSGSPNISNLP